MWHPLRLRGTPRRAARLAHAIRWRLAAAIALLTVAAGCGPWRNDTVRASVEVVAGDRAVAVGEVSLIVGGERVSWPGIGPGESKSATLLPGAQDDRQLTLLYARGAERKTWEGPKFPPGTGYRIALRIMADDSVTARHCVLPCALE